MSIDNSHLTAVRSMLRTRDHQPHTRTRVATPAGPNRPTRSSADAQRLQPVPAPASGAGGMVELLWNERREESYDLTHRIAVPLAGHRLAPDASHLLGATLAAWWIRQPGVLSNGTEVTFVDVEVREEPLTPRELIVTLTTSTPASEAQVANLRTIRDLRRAVREVRRGDALAHPGLAVVA